MDNANAECTETLPSASKTTDNTQDCSSATIDTASVKPVSSADVGVESDSVRGRANNSYGDSDNVTDAESHGSEVKITEETSTKEQLEAEIKEGCENEPLIESPTNDNSTSGTQEKSCEEGAEQNIVCATNGADESSNMEVEELSNAASKCDKLDTFEIEEAKKISENSQIADPEGNNSQDGEVSQNPSEINVNPVVDETSMNVSELGDQSMEGVQSEGPEQDHNMEDEEQSMDQDMQVENAGGDTMDVTMAKVDVQQGAGEESMEVASADEDPIGLISENQNHQEEQMEIGESIEDSAKHDETEDRTKENEASKEGTATEDDESRHMEEESRQSAKLDEEARDGDRNDSGKENANQGEVEEKSSVDDSVARSIREYNEDEETRDTGKIDQGTREFEQIDLESRDSVIAGEDTRSSFRDNAETKEASEVQDTSDNACMVDDLVKESSTKEKEDKEKKAEEEHANKERGIMNASKDKAQTETAAGSSNDASKQTTEKASEAAKDKDEDVCIIPDDVPRNDNKEAKKDTPVPQKEVEVQLPSKVEKPDVVVTHTHTPKMSRRASSKSAEKKDPAYIGAETKVEYNKHSRPQRQAAKRAETQIKELAEEDSNSNEEDFGSRSGDEFLEIEATTQMCFQCCRLRTCKFQVYVTGKLRYLCQEECYNVFRKQSSQKTQSRLREPGDRSMIRKCSQCSTTITGDEKNLSWETMDFCNEECLGKYQTQLGSHCANCKGPVQPVSLGKYCVRFGYDIKQFCCSTCLEEFKKGLKVCSYCQKDISSGAEGFLAPVGDKGQFKDFCTQACMEKYDQMSNNQPPPTVIHQCAVCNNEKPVKVEVVLENKTNKLCSEPCFAAFKFVNKVNADQCDMCKKYFDKSKTEVFSVYYDDAPHSFCCKTCMNVYILANRKIVPCNWCKVKKYNFDMIKRVTGNGQILMMCSLNCLTLYQVSVNAVSAKRIKCDLCNSVAQAQYHLTMSDATIRNFCSYQCVMSFQGQYSKSTPITFAGNSSPIPTGGPKRATTRRVPQSQNENDMPGGKTGGSQAMPVISNVTSLATPNGQPVPAQNNAGITTRSGALKVNNSNIQASPVGKETSVMYKQQVIVKPPPPKVMRNKVVSCKPYMHTKGVSCRPHPSNKETQTETEEERKPVLIPVPVPIYVPAPMHMYSSPFPVPVPFPLPVPVPIFIPTTRNSAHGIMKEIKRIQEKIPTDPFEAELLMMAEMVAGEKKVDNSDSDSDDGGNGAGDVNEVAGASSAAEGGFSPEAVDTSNTFGEDMLQMALKMASELEEPAVDLEAALTSSTITAQSQTSVEQNEESEDDPEPAAAIPETRANRGRKRPVRTASRTSSGGGGPSKRGRRISSSVDIPLLPPPEPQPPPRVEQEKPDANMCLKYTFGVNAWKQWVMAKNAELEKAAANNRKLKLFKPEILQLTADELNYSLCLFVKEVRKPNGSEYAPDTIYYLCLGIQQYLFENGRIDNIFTDSYYEKFTECLDEVAKKFSVLYNDSQYIVTRVEEEHLWESKQLGAHSPHVLLSTLMFFNTKHFNLTTVEEHMQLSFSHIMKHWKRNPNQTGVTKIPGSSRNVLLRFYPPQSALEANSRKKKVYEQQENEENPLRCPVKLYEFYLSKCPESVKTRNDVFYLLPERSCVPDSPVWYSTMALGKEPLMKMLHRVKMVKEINIALLSS